MYTPSSNPGSFTYNVTNKFLKLFATGFVLQLSALLGTLIACIGLQCQMGSFVTLGSGLLGFLQVLGGLIWFLAAMAYRWKTSGQICSNDDATPGHMTQV